MRTRQGCNEALTCLFGGTRTAAWIHCGFCTLTSAALLGCMWHPCCTGFDQCFGTLGMCAHVTVHAGVDDQCAWCKLPHLVMDYTLG